MKLNNWYSWLIKLAILALFTVSLFCIFDEIKCFYYPDSCGPRGLLPVVYSVFIFATVMIQNLTFIKPKISNFIPSGLFGITFFIGSNNFAFSILLILACISVLFNVWKQKIVWHNFYLLPIIAAFAAFNLPYFVPTFIAQILFLSLLLYPFGIFVYSKIKIKNNVSK
jgi:hypothetical protein